MSDNDTVTKETDPQTPPNWTLRFLWAAFLGLLCLIGLVKAAKRFPAIRSQLGFHSWHVNEAKAFSNSQSIRVAEVIYLQKNGGNVEVDLSVLSKKTDSIEALATGQSDQYQFQIVPGAQAGEFTVIATPNDNRKREWRSFKTLHTGETLQRLPWRRDWTKLK